MKVLILDAPDDAVQAIELPQVDMATGLSDGPCDHVVFFVRAQSQLDRRFPQLKRLLTDKGKLWIAWPKAGKLGTDLNIREVIRIGYDHGMVESVNLRIDETWTALKFTHPKPGKTYNNSYGRLPS